jgi:hypothetical protein
MADSPEIKKDPENLNEPGDVITETLSIRTALGQDVDIKNFCIGLTLFEDMFSNVLMGEAILGDSAGLVSAIQFQGFEYLTLSYRTPSFKEMISKTFFITKVSERFFSADDRQQAYRISFISIEAQADNNTKLSKKFTGITSDIVGSIYNTYLKVPRVAGSTAETPFFMNNALGSSASFVAASWSPFRTINWLAARSFKSATSAPNYMFFESNKAFYFVSVEDLITQQRNTGKIFAEYIFFPGAATIQAPNSGKFSFVKPELLKQYSMVRNMRPFTMIDVLSGQDYGYYASKLIVNDLTLKTFQMYPFDYHKTHTQFNNLEDYTINRNVFGSAPQKKTQTFSSKLQRNPETYQVVRTRQYKLHNDLKDPLYEKWALQRNSMMYELGALRLEIEVPGRTDIEVGKVVNFLYPKSIDKTAGMLMEDALDPYMSGLYIITAIRHVFSVNKHTMYLELAKDSFRTELT